MVNNRKRFGNELLQQETEFNVCMKSERASDGPKAWHISPFSACLQMLSQMLLWNRHPSRMDLARQYPEVIFYYIYVLFDGTWLVFQSVSNW